MSFRDYLSYRVRLHFSTFSLFKPYALMMSQMRQITNGMLISNTRDLQYEKEMTN